MGIYVFTFERNIYKKVNEYFQTFFQHHHHHHHHKHHTTSTIKEIEEAGMGEGENEEDEVIS